MFNIGTGELIMIAVVALLVLGPTRLPELARGIGKFMREFRRQTDDVRNVVEREFYRMDQEINTEQPPPGAPQILPPQGAVPQASDPAALDPAAPPQQAELPLQQQPLDESEPGHPDHNREEKPESAAAATPAGPPEQKAG